MKGRILADAKTIGKRSKRKGRSFEQKVARDLREIFPPEEVKRVPQNQAGHGKPDIYAPGLSVECKHRQRPNLRAALQQVTANTAQGTTGVAVVKYHRAETVVVMKYDDFLDLIEEHHQRGQ